jgi:hypothetical protein
LAARVLTGDSPLELVKTSGSSHGGGHSAAVKMEVSNPCMNETDKVIRSPDVTSIAEPETSLEQNEAE